MCTNVTITAAIEGSAKGAGGWRRVDTAFVSFDHPFHAPFDHALTIDLVNGRAPADGRVAIELSAQSARALVESILRALDQGEAEAGLALAEGRGAGA
jgi:hypothetical protein